MKLLTVTIPVSYTHLMEHIERAGVHSGDSISVYPAYSLSQKIIDTIEDYTRKLAMSLHVKGMINIQFIVCDGKVYVIAVSYTHLDVYKRQVHIQSEWKKENEDMFVTQCRKEYIVEINS